MTDIKKRKAKHGKAYSLVRDILRKVTGKIGAIYYKQYRDETTGRFISKERAVRQARKGNVMVHRVHRVKGSSAKASRV